MADGVTELVGNSYGIPFSLLTVLRTNPSALGVSSTAGLMFLGRSCVLVPRMAPLDDTKVRSYHLRLSKRDEPLLSSMDLGLSR
ncbi:hypothetical protein Tco_1528615 [Tanacetum coccineum]